MALNTQIKSWLLIALVLISTGTCPYTCAKAQPAEVASHEIVVRYDTNGIFVPFSSDLNAAVFERAGWKIIVLDTQDILDPSPLFKNKKLQATQLDCPNCRAFMFKSSQAGDVVSRVADGLWIHSGEVENPSFFLTLQQFSEGPRLVIPTKNPGRIFKLSDIASDKPLWVGTQNNALSSFAPSKTTPEFLLLSSQVGTALVPFVAHTQLKSTHDGFYLGDSP